MKESVLAGAAAKIAIICETPEVWDTINDMSVPTVVKSFDVEETSGIDVWPSVEGWVEGIWVIVEIVHVGVIDGWLLVTIVVEYGVEVRAAADVVAVVVWLGDSCVVVIDSNVDEEVVWAVDDSDTVVVIIVVALDKVVVVVPGAEVLVIEVVAVVVGKLVEVVWRPVVDWLEL